MKKTFLSLVVLASLYSCNMTVKTDTVAEEFSDIHFENYKEHFVDELWKLNPGWASSQGYHKYDSVLLIPDDAYEQKQLQFSAIQLDSLKKYSLENLSDNNKTDYHMIKNLLESIVFNIKEVKSDEWDPSAYNVSGSFAEMLNGNYDSLEARLKNISLKMDNIPAYYEAAKKNIKNPTLEHTQLAIAQNLGGISVF